MVADFKLQMSGYPERLRFLPLSADGGGEQLAIKFVADGVNMAALSDTKEIAGTADFQVAQSDTKAGAKLGIFLYGHESFGGCGIDGSLRRQKHISIGAIFISSDTAAKLMQFGQTKPVGVVNNDSVGVWYVQAGFDDGGAHKNVSLIVNEIKHVFFEFIL